MRARFTVGKNIKTKLLFPSVALIFVICIIFSLSSLNSLRGAITDLGISQGKLAAKAVTDAINPADISKVTISHQNKQAINRIRASLDSVSANSDIKSAYTIIKKNDQFVYQVDGAKNNPATLGTAFTSNHTLLSQAFAGQVATSSKIQKTNQGYLITAYRPIFNKNDQVIAVVGVDFRADKAITMLKKRHLSLLE